MTSGVTHGAWKSARDAGEIYYFTGIPCKNGHIEKRTVARGQCVQCKNEINSKNRDKKKDSERHIRNKEINNLKARERYWKTRENSLSKHREWTAKNLPIKALIERRRRAVAASADGDHCVSDILNIFTNQNGLCAMCFSDVSLEYHVDHIIPLSKGGSNWPENLQILCPSCNCKKGSKCP